VLQEGPRAEKIPYPPVAPTAADRSEPFGVLINVITPRLGLRPQYWWPGLGVVGGFVIGIGMAGPGFGVLARKAFVTSG